MKIQFPLNETHQGKRLTGLTFEGEVLQVEIEPWSKDSKYVFVRSTNRSFTDETNRPILIQFAHLCFKDAAPMEWEIKSSKGIEKMSAMESTVEKKPKHNTSTSVYFIKGGKFVKIGVARNVAARISGLQVGCPVELTLLASIDGGHATERQLHKMFNHHRTRGEWFNFHKEIKEYITNTLS